MEPKSCMFQVNTWLTSLLLNLFHEMVFTCFMRTALKMLYLIGPDGLVNLSLENFQKI